MLKNILDLDNAQALSKEQQKVVKGGGVPAPDTFCCGNRPQQWWIDRYPFLANSPYYDCSNINCNNNGGC